MAANELFGPMFKYIDDYIKQCEASQKKYRDQRQTFEFFIAELTELKPLLADAFIRSVKLSQVEAEHFDVSPVVECLDDQLRKYETQLTRISELEDIQAGGMDSAEAESTLISNKGHIKKYQKHFEIFRNRSLKDNSYMVKEQIKEAWCLWETPEPDSSSARQSKSGRKKKKNTKKEKADDLVSNI